MGRAWRAAVGIGAFSGATVTISVLQLVTYPSRLPTAGGQVRVANIRRVYEQAGFRVTTVSVYEPEIHDPRNVGEHDVPFPPSSPFRQSQWPLCNDLLSGDFALNDTSARDRIAAIVRDAKVNVIQLEQPWLLGIAEYLAAHAVPGAKLIHSSQNIEAPTKYKVLMKYHVKNPDAICQRIAGLERDATQKSALTIAVTDDDARVLSAHGGGPVVVARNGIAQRTIEPTALRDWTWQLRHDRIALFVGSAYPFNVDGFWTVFERSLAFLAPDEKILVVGGISGLLAEHPAFHRHRAINASRLLLTGILPEAALAAVLTICKCIILPVTEGGGSNIKTAEAVLSGKPVIGTTKSFLGYDFALTLPHMYRIDDADTFAQTVKLALNDALPPSDGVESPALRTSVTWDHTLSALPGHIRALFSEQGAS